MYKKIKRVFSAILIIASIMITLLSQSLVINASTDLTELKYDITNLTDEKKVDILKTFAPKVYLHSKEDFYPSSIEFSLEHLTKVKDPKYNSNRLITIQDLESPTSILPYFTGQSNLSKVPVYSFWVDKGDNIINLVYFTYYPYNRGKQLEINKLVDLLPVGILSSLPKLASTLLMGNHVGDWENVTISLLKSEAAGKTYVEPMNIYLSQHESEDKVLYIDYPEVDITHPIVYAAKGSHGLYKDTGDHKYKDYEVAYLADTCDRGAEWNTWNCMETFEYKYTSEGPTGNGLGGTKWYEEFGKGYNDFNSNAIARWGNYKDGIELFGESELDNGPLGPQEKSQLNDPNSYKDIDAKIKEPIIDFFEGNNCEQDILGSLSTDKDNKLNLKEDKLDGASGTENDEIRSARLLNVKAGTIIKVYDDPDCEESDDYTEITVKKSINYFKINTFEDSHDDDKIEIKYHKDNGLSGKISGIIITHTDKYKEQAEERPSATPTTEKPSSVTFKIENNTNFYKDEDVYWTVLGYDITDAGKKLIYINDKGEKKEATMEQCTEKDNINRVWDTRISNKLSVSNSFNLDSLESARLYISYKSPMKIPFVISDEKILNFAAPDFNNDTDPNLDITFDFIEFTKNDKGLWANTTRVDAYAFPLSLTLVGADINKTVGDIGSRDEIFSQFKNEVPEEFKSLVKANRILAPCKGGFDKSIPAITPTYPNYFDNYIDEVWSYYKNNDLIFDHPLGKFKGRVSDEKFVFTKDNESETYIVKKPTTADVLEGKGAFNDAGDSTDGEHIKTLKAIEAQLCAAFNRHVAKEPSKWNDPSAYYKSAPANYYAKFWHDHSLDKLTYGFCYDDVADQSSTLKYDKPCTLTVSCGWGNIGSNTNVSSTTPSPIPATSWFGIKASTNGNYVCADNYGNDPLTASRTSISDWEQFQVINNSDGTISLLSKANAKYVCADINQSSKLIARSDSISDWEKFIQIPQSDGTFALRAKANNKIVCADGNEGVVLYANRDTIGSWETFKLVTP